MCARAATPHPVVSVRVGVCAASMSLDFVSRHELVSPNAGRRTDFRDKKSSDFSGEIFRERNYCPRTGFSGSNP